MQKMLMAWLQYLNNSENWTIIGYIDSVTCVSWLYFIKPVADLNSSKCVCRVSLVGSKNALYFATMIPLLFWAFARNQSRLLSKQVDLSLFTHGRGTTSTFVLAVCPASCTGKDTPEMFFITSQCNISNRWYISATKQDSKWSRESIFAWKKKLERWVSMQFTYFCTLLGLGFYVTPLKR